MFGRKQRKQRKSNSSKAQGPQQEIVLPKSEDVIGSSLDHNIELFKNLLKGDSTLIVRKFKNLFVEDFRCSLLYIDGMIDVEVTTKNIIHPIMSSDYRNCLTETEDKLSQLEEGVISSSNVKRSSSVQELVLAIFYGDSILFVDGYSQALIIDSKGWQMRAVEEPDAEKVIRGPREGFTESMLINITLVRRKIRTPELKFVFKELGVKTHTNICVSYIEGVANEKIVKEVFQRLDKIEIDGILESSYIQEQIKDSPYSPLNTIGNTERPDVAAADLLEGRVIIFVDGTPSVLTLPYVFMEYFQASEDYYNNFIFGSINRLIRVFGTFIAIGVAPFYISLTAFQQEMIPSPLIIGISAARQGVPFPTVVEALILLFIFEVLREAGTRMPTNMGQAISIVGALVLGQAAVDANLVSAPILIVVALTGITGLLIPRLIGPAIIARLILLGLSAFMGLYGFIFGIIGIFIYLFSLRSFGVPYMINVGSIKAQDVKDTTIRAPWWQMYERPRLITGSDNVRKSSVKKRGK